MREPLPLTSGRRLALAIGLPLVLALIGWGALTEIAWGGQGSYPVRLNLPARGRTVTITVPAGQLRVRPAAGDSVRLTGTAHYAIARSRVIWTTADSGVTVSSQCRFPTGPCSFDYQIAVPAGQRTVVSDGSGDLTLRGLGGPVRAGDGSGDVHAFGLSGAVGIADQSGDISGSDLSGPRVVIQNQSGNITISGLASPDVSAFDSSGGITLIFTKVPDRIRVTDDSGDVRLVLPRGDTAYHVSTSTSSGTAVVQVPTNSSSPHVITVTDQSGNITITN